MAALTTTATFPPRSHHRHTSSSSPSSIPTDEEKSQLEVISSPSQEEDEEEEDAHRRSLLGRKCLLNNQHIGHVESYSPEKASFQVRIGDTFIYIPPEALLPSIKAFEALCSKQQQLHVPPPPPPPPPPVINFNFPNSDKLDYSKLLQQQNMLVDSLMRSSSSKNSSSSLGDAYGQMMPSMRRTSSSPDFNALQSISMSIPPPTTTSNAFHPGLTQQHQHFLEQDRRYARPMRRPRSVQFMTNSVDGPAVPQFNNGNPNLNSVMQQQNTRRHSVLLGNNQLNSVSSPSPLHAMYYQGMGNVHMGIPPPPPPPPPPPMYLHNAGHSRLVHRNTGNSSTANNSVHTTANHSSVKYADSVKTEIYNTIKKFYLTDEAANTEVSIPAYADIEAELKSLEYRNAVRVCTLRARFILRKTLKPVVDKLELKTSVEKYIVNALIHLCPFCGEAVMVSNLGSGTNWFKHIKSSHGVIGKVFVHQFEYYESNEHDTSNLLKYPDDALLDNLTLIDADSIARNDMAPLDSSKEEIEKFPNLLPHTTSYCLESLLFNNLLQAEALTNEAVVTQEVVAFGLLKYRITSRTQIRRLMPQLVQFQCDMKDMSPEAFDCYVAVGHPNLLLPPGFGERNEEEKEMDEEALEKAVDALHEVPAGSNNTKKSEVKLLWRAKLLDMLLDDTKLTTSCVLVQELSVLAYFYYGFINQRTPKKLQRFDCLEKFLTRLYKLSSKAYEIYNGVGPTGVEYTRGKPVTPSKEILQKYNHYGLSRKSLQRSVNKDLNSSNNSRVNSLSVNMAQHSLQDFDVKKGHRTKFGAPTSGKRGSVGMKRKSLVMTSGDVDGVSVAIEAPPRQRRSLILMPNDVSGINDPRADLNLELKEK